jgi:hypothetical protein
MRWLASHRPLNLDNFLDLVEVEFRWLAEECGFSVGARKRFAYRYAAVLFINATSHVRIGWEPQDNDYLSLEVGPLDGAKAAGGYVPGQSYPLWLITWARSGDEGFARSLTKCRGESKRDVRATLVQNSHALKMYGSDILLGDFSTFRLLDAANDARMKANMQHEAWPDPRRIGLD